MVDNAIKNNDITFSGFVIQVCEYALDNIKGIGELLLEKVQVLMKFRQVVKKTGKTENFNPEELADMNLFLEKMYGDQQSCCYLPGNAGTQQPEHYTEIYLQYIDGKPDL